MLRWQGRSGRRLATGDRTGPFAARLPRSRQAGLSLVELLVGATIGLFVSAAAILGVTGALHENRQLLLEARLQQDLRAALDLITRDLRRAGFWSNAHSGLGTAGATLPVHNPYAAITAMPPRPARTAGAAPVSAEGTAGSALTYSWAGDRNDTLDNGETFDLQLATGRLRMRISGGTWQDLTDANSVVVTALRITPAVTWFPLHDHCPQACDPLLRDCPELALRSVTVSVTGRLPQASSGVTRTLTSQVRLRNSELTGACP